MKLLDISGKKKKEYPKAKIDGFKLINRIKNIREIRDFKNGYQPRTNIVKDEKGDSVTDSLSILAWWRNHFSQLFSAHGVSDVRQR